MISTVLQPRVSETTVCVTFGALLRWAPGSFWVATLHRLSSCTKACKTTGILTVFAQYIVKPMKFQQFSSDILLTRWTRHCTTNSQQWTTTQQQITHHARESQYERFLHVICQDEMELRRVTGSDATTA